MDISVKKMRQLLLSDQAYMGYFMNNYFKDILAYVPQTNEADPYSNPMIQLYVDHMSKILRTSTGSTPTKVCASSDHMYFPESLVEEGKRYIHTHMCEKLHADFSAPDFYRGTYYIMVSKHASVNIIGKDVYSVICLCASKEAVTQEQHMAAFDLIYKEGVGGKRGTSDCVGGSHDFFFFFA